MGGNGPGPLGALDGRGESSLRGAMRVYKGNLKRPPQSFKSAYAASRGKQLPQVSPRESALSLLRNHSRVVKLSLPWHARARVGAEGCSGGSAEVRVARVNFEGCIEAVASRQRSIKRMRGWEGDAVEAVAALEAEVPQVRGPDRHRRQGLSPVQVCTGAEVPEVEDPTHERRRIQRGTHRWTGAVATRRRAARWTAACTSQTERGPSQTPAGSRWRRARRASSTA